jgi:Redoxin
MASADAESAKDVLQSYCEKTTALVTARRFSSACIEVFGSEVCPWAQTIIDSGADAGAGPSFHNLEGMTGFSNGSDELGAHVVVESSLVSQWDGAVVARRKHSFLLEPGTKGTLFDDSFQQDNAGWGDYLVRSEVKVTMNRGKYPRATYLPAISRTTQEAVVFAPHAELHDSSLDPASQPWTTDGERAFTSALLVLQRQAFLAVEKQPAAARKKKPTDLFDRTSAALRELGGWYAKRTGPSSLVGRPLPTIGLQRWVRPMEGIEEQSPKQMPTGNVLQLDFMFTGCVPCREALPGLSGLYDKYHERGLVVVSLCPSWGQSGVHGLIERLRVSHPVAVLEKDVERAFQIEGYPTYVLVDRKGTIRWVGVGGEPEEKRILPLLEQERP